MPDKMDEWLTRLVILPNSLLCASLGAFIGSWLGGLGVTIDGESHLFLRGSIRGALSFGIAGWNLPLVILAKATHDERPYARGSLIPALLPNPIQLQLELAYPQQYGTRLEELKQTHRVELRKLHAQIDYQKRKAQDSMLAAAAAGSLANELESLFLLEENTIQQQLQLLSKGKTDRFVRREKMFSDGDDFETPAAHAARQQANVEEKEEYEEKEGVEY